LAVRLDDIEVIADGASKFFWEHFHAAAPEMSGAPSFAVRGSEPWYGNRAAHEGFHTSVELALGELDVGENDGDPVNVTSARQRVDVPVQGLVPSQMTLHPRAKSSLGAADVGVRARLQPHAL